jgi:hypothetical protein
MKFSLIYQWFAAFHNQPNQPNHIFCIYREKIFRENFLPLTNHLLLIFTYKKKIKKNG